MNTGKNLYGFYFLVNTAFNGIEISFAGDNPTSTLQPPGNPMECSGSSSIIHFFNNRKWA